MPFPPFLASPADRVGVLRACKGIVLTTRNSIANNCVIAASSPSWRAATLSMAAAWEQRVGLSSGPSPGCIKCGGSAHASNVATISTKHFSRSVASWSAVSSSRKLILLEALNLQGCTVTLDAMGCQKDIAEQIREQKGHYILALKGNQSGLEEDLRQLYVDHINTDFAGLKHAVYNTEETGHGRQEQRSCEVIEIPADHPQRSIWKDLRTLVILTCTRIIGPKETSETRLYISSHKPQAKLLAAAIRQHWGIENTQHWSLDVTFGEDVRRQQDRHGAANLAAVRRLSLSLLRQEKTNKRGLKNKRLACALDPDYLLTVLKNAAF